MTLLVAQGDLGGGLGPGSGHFGEGFLLVEDEVGLVGGLLEGGVVEGVLLREVNVFP